MSSTKNHGVQLYEELSEQRPRLTKEWFKKPMEAEELETLMQVGDYIDDYFLMAMRYKAGIEFRRHKEEQGKAYKDWLTANLTVSDSSEKNMRRMADNVDDMVKEGHKLAEIFQLTSKELYKSKSLRPGEDPPPRKPRAVAEKPEEAPETSEDEDDSIVSEESEKPEEDSGLSDIVDSLNDESLADKTPVEAAINKAEELGDPPDDIEEAKAWVVDSLERELQVVAKVLLLSTDKRRRKALLMECFFRVADLSDVPLKNKA